MAKNILKIWNYYHCKNYNQLYLNQDAFLNAHIEITFMILSI